MSFVLVAAVTLAVVSGSLAFAQCGVRGLASIHVSNTNVGTLSINVAKAGNILTGEFRYTEVSPTGTRPVCIIYSQRLTSVDVRGNFATVKAVGFWNGIASNLLIEALDDNPSGDWLHVQAIPINSMLPVQYNAAGGVFRGDLVVYAAPPVTGYANGEGTIAVPNSASIVPNIGKFAFKAQSTSAGVQGAIAYTEYTPTAATAIQRPKAAIYVPQVQSLVITGNTAVLKGKGTLNGRPADVEVTAIDTGMLMDPSGSPVNRPDEFYIKAVTIVGDTEMPTIIYQAGNPLKTGYIVVGSTTTP